MQLPYIKRFCIVWLLLSGTTSAVADSFRIEFSGSFGLNNSRIESPLVNLENQPFSGVIEVFDGGDIEVEEVNPYSPWDEDALLYTFRTKSFMSLDTPVSDFNLEADFPIEVLVTDCLIDCPIFRDHVRIVFRTEAYWFSLVLGSTVEPFNGTDIPANTVLRTMHADMQIFSENLDESIRSDVGGVTFQVMHKLRGPNGDDYEPAPTSTAPAINLLLDE